MKYDLSRCPHCNIELDYVERTYVDNSGDYYYETWEGVCPECDRRYNWDEIYSFERVDNLKELK